MEVLSRSQWEARAEAHRDRLLPYVAPHLARREARLKHPVHDFMFDYYSQRPAHLLRWHPGYGVGLADAPTHAEPTHAEPVEAPRPAPRPAGVTAAYLASQRPLVQTLLRLLRATAARPANLGCFGMHEWAMVYRCDETGGTRHPQPLRLGAAATDAVVESQRIACTHFDAYRFFTPAAQPLNALRPAAGNRPDFEQPGCLHGNMDLYKTSYRLLPLICSDLVADAFELAWRIRIMDMRAAPYDLTGIRLDPTGEPWTPLKVETPEGKREYVGLQRHYAEQAAPIRARLIAECERLLSVPL